MSATELTDESVAAWLRRKLEEELDEVKFRLKYDGPLPSASNGNSRRKEKNQIRWKLHHQLVTVVMEGNFGAFKKRDEGEAATFARRKFKDCRFGAVISASHELICNLSIQLERRDLIGGIFSPEGDLDNRIKTLLDALRLPQNENEVMPPDDPNQKKTCLCLLEDDSLITGLNIQTITSLEDLPKGHVRLSIDVEVKAHDLQYQGDE